MNDKNSAHSILYHLMESKIEHCKRIQYYMKIR